MRYGIILILCREITSHGRHNTDKWTAGGSIPSCSIIKVGEKMKNKYVFTAALLACLTAVSVLLSVCFGKTQEDKEGMLVVTSFYPVYIAAINVTDGIDGVTVRQLSQPSTGCVHDHQLTTQDMLLLEKADVLIINGAGMESYLTDVMERYPELDIIDTSQGAALLESEGGHTHHEDEHDHGEAGHTHDEDDHDHDHTDNAHIWMNMDNYCVQIGNIGNGLAERDEAHRQQYESNESAYIEKVQQLKEESRQRLAGVADKRAVSTHEAFSYFADNFDWEIEHTINMDENTALSAAQVGEIIEAVRGDSIPCVFTEKIYGTRLGAVLKEETSAEMVILDTLVTGEDNRNAYLEGMRRNIDGLMEVTEQ